MPVAEKAADTSIPATESRAKPKPQRSPPASSANLTMQIADGKTQNPAADPKPFGAPFRAAWRNPDSYPPPNCKDIAWLAWEFLRRNEKYALHVRQMLALPQGEFSGGLTSKGNACLDGMACTPKAKPGETVKQYRKRTAAEAGGKKGVIEKPQMTFVNRWMIEHPVPVERPHDGNDVKFVPNVVKAYRNMDLAGRRVRLMMYHNEMAIRFRLDLKPLEQIKQAEKMLKRAVQRFARDAKASKRTSDGDPLISHADSRIKDIVNLAHYWLRAYDADSVPRRLLDEDKNRKRTLKDGATEIAKVFRDEAVANKSKITFARGRVPGFQSSAKTMVDKRGYQKLMRVLEATDKKISKQHVWPSLLQA